MNPHLWHGCCIMRPRNFQNVELKCHIITERQDERKRSLSYNSPPSMSRVFLKILAVLVLVLANGFFVAVEFALVSVRRSKIETLAAAKKSGARSLLRALDRLDPMLSTRQLGIATPSLALGAVGGAT